MKSIIFTTLLLCAGIWHYGITFFVSVFAISFLIFFHELGHFLAARQLKVAVTTFSIGFGEKIYSKVVGGTEYRISAILLGGYVSLKGQVDSDPTAKSNEADSYTKLSPLGRIYILFAGPFFNLFLAFLLYVSLGFIGVEKLAPTIGFVKADSAAMGKLDVNDTILSINSNQIREWDDISKHVSLNRLNLEVKSQDGTIKNVTIDPKIGKNKTMFGEEILTPLIGISPSGTRVMLYHKGFDSLKFGLQQTYESSKLIFTSLSKVVQRVVSPKELGGIITITDIMTKAASTGVSVIFIIVALISVNLGIINLFPIPALDGGHIMFNLYELIFRRPVNERVFAILSYAGIAFLMSLMAFTIINDIIRLSGGYN